MVYAKWLLIVSYRIFLLLVAALPPNLSTGKTLKNIRKEIPITLYIYFSVRTKVL